MDQEKFVDVGKVLKEKAPGLEKWLPSFAINWIKRRLREEEINKAMIELKNYHGLEFNAKGLEMLGTSVESVNAHLVPEKGRIIVASNHPLGGLDGMALIKAVGEIRPDVRFFVNDVLKKIENFGDVFVGVNKVGSTSPKHLRTMEDILISDDAVLIFPAGLVSRKQKKKIIDLDWKKSFVTQAIDHERYIVPTFIEGTNSKFFYNFANARKNLGIKGNFEMLCLPDEMFKQKAKNIRIHFSKPFSAEILDKSRSHREWAQLIKRYIYSEEFHKGIPFEEFLKIKY